MKEVIASANFEKTRKHGGIKTGYEEGGGGGGGKSHNIRSY